jgi:hypothetical protein
MVVGVQHPIHGGKPQSLTKANLDAHARNDGGDLSIVAKVQGWLEETKSENKKAWDEEDQDLWMELCKKDALAADIEAAIRGSVEN